MRKSLSIILIFCAFSSTYGQKKTKLNRGTDVVKALVTEPEDLAIEIAVGEAIEQGVTEWILKNRTIAHGDAMEITFLSMSKSEAGQGTNVLMKIKQNDNPSEVLMLVFPEDNNTQPRVMYISKSWITQTMQVIMDVANEDSTYLGPSDHGFNLRFTKKESVRSADGTYNRIEVQKDLDVSLANLKKWNGQKLIFEDTDAGEAKVELLNSGSGDIHRFGFHPDGNFVIDYTEWSVRIWDKENQMYFTLPLVDIIRVLFQE